MSKFSAFQFAKFLLPFILVDNSHIYIAGRYTENPTWCEVETRELKLKKEKYTSQMISPLNRNEGFFLVGGGSGLFGFKILLFFTRRMYSGIA